MATHLQTEPSLQRLQSITQPMSNSNSVNFSTQLSINDSCDSFPTTSAHLMFICRTNTNLNGNLLFPLAEKHKHTTKHSEKISWHNLLKYLKSQRIVKSIEIFKKFKRKQKYDSTTQQFPLDLQKIKKEKFPCHNAIEDGYSNVYTPPFQHKRKVIYLKTLKFPTKLATGKRTFPCNGKDLKEKNKNVLNVRDYKTRQLSSKFKQHFSNLKRPLRKLPIETNLKRFPGTRNKNCETNKKFPLKDNLPSFDRNHEKPLKFPQKLTQNKGEFPFENKSQINTNLNIKNFKQHLQIRKVSEISPRVTTTIYDEQRFQNLITKFPYESYLKYQLTGRSCPTKFPIRNDQINHKHDTQLQYSLNENSDGKNAFFPSLSMAQSDEKMENIDNEHVVLQVQDAQVHVEKQPRSLTTTKNIQPPPQAATAKTINDDDHDDVNKLTNINSINNNQANEVGYYAEKIERIQDAIVALFEKIQNSLTNHNSEHKSTNAAKRDHSEGNNCFASTPPMSVTSVHNSESNDYDEVLHKKYDLDDLCDRQDGQIVECSDVHDTLAETVDYGDTKEQTKSTGTGNLLVKSEEPISPNSLIPNPLDKSEYTSLKDCINASDVLPKNDVLAVKKDVKNNLEFDRIKKIDILKCETEGTVIKTCDSNLASAKVNETSVTRLTKNEQEIAQNEKDPLQSSKVLEQTNDILCKDLQNYEMKFEMNRVKSALPSSISERSLGKHDELITKSNNVHYGPHTGINTTRLASDIPSNNNRLPYSLDSTRNYHDSSYTPRSSLKNESSTLATTVPKRSTLPLVDGVTNRSVISTPSLNETISSRAALNDYNSDTHSQRCPSLRTLGNTQSTSLLSVDLPRYTPLTAKTDQTTPVNRAVSIDSSLGDILPERTRLRRQRRLRSQNTQDEPEDAIERLNRLKARISASLSEVKGVLKQYSTEAENENETQTAASASSLREAKLEEEKEGPIVFRFVKKVRRRSLFAEEDDEKVEKKAETNSELLKDTTKNNLDKQREIEEETTNSNSEIESTLPTHNAETVEESNKKPLEIQIEEKCEAQPPQLDTNKIQINTDLYTLKEEVREALEDVSQTESKTGQTIMDCNENNKTPKDELRILKEETRGAIPKPSAKRDSNNMENDSPAHETTKKAKKKIVIKSKDPIRRASLAAVEGSKIEPAVNIAIPAKIQRRPSDSEAVVKKKISAKTNTSGVVEEVTPKPKIVKVKKSATKDNKNSQLATTQTNLKDKDTLETTESKQIDDHAKHIDKDNKSIPTDINKDVLMPKQPEPKLQQQFNTEITRQTNLLQPTQLVIDEAASLNKKTIENSVLSPREQQQQQQHQNREQDQQATLKSTATGFLSNDLQAKGAMLENITNVLSSSTTIEANRQIERENCVQQEDLHDLLQEETTFVKPFTTNKENEPKLLDQVRNLQTTEKPKGNWENVLATTREQQENSATQQQQVSTTTDVVHVKSEDNDDNNSNNKHEDIKAKASLKEPCIDKSITSTHDEADHQQQQQQHHQLLVVDEQSITNVVDTKTISSPLISISSTSDITHKTTTASLLPTDSAVEEKAEVSANQHNTMPEQQLAFAPVQTADIISHPEHHKKKIIIKKIVRQPSTDKTKQADLDKTTPTQETKQVAVEPTTNESNLSQEAEAAAAAEELDDECSESNEISESSASIGSEEISATRIPKKERKVKKKVIIKRQKRRLSVSDNFFRSASEEGTQNVDVETLEKPIAYVSDDDSESSDKKDEEAQNQDQVQEEKKPLKSCILHKEYNIGDEVLYAERFKKTQIKWRRGRIKERITSISYLLDIDGKDVSSHINYLKKFTGRKVSFGGKEYLEIDYEQLAEEEEKAEKLQKRTYSIWNMV